MFRPGQRFRPETFYEGPYSDHNKINARVIGPYEDDPEGNPQWKVALPHKPGRILIVFEDELSPQPDAPATIAEQVEHMLTWNHPLLHGFVVEALVRYSEQVLAEREKLIEDMKTSFISGEAWVHCAEVVVEEFGRPKT